MTTPAQPSATRSPLLNLWADADERVPFPFLFYWIARPHHDHHAGELSGLTHVDFVYGTTTDFIVVLGFRHHAFTPALVERAPMSKSEFRFIPLMGLQRIRLTPEQAQAAIERHLREQKHPFWDDFFLHADPSPSRDATDEGHDCFERYRRLPWHSVRLEQPRKAGITEPRYVFRRAHARAEFQVGAQTGLVTRVDLRDIIAPPPGAEHPGP